MTTVPLFNAKLLDDYREYPGGNWQIAGSVLDFLLSSGLRRHHHLVEVGCGPLRIGKHLIAFLDAGCYTGIEPEASMLEAGLAKELSSGLRALQRPTFLNETLGATRLATDWALAWDVFNHLSDDQLRLALATISADNWLLNVHVGQQHQTFPKDEEGWSYRYADAKAQVYTPASLESLLRDSDYRLTILKTVPTDWEGFPFAILHLTTLAP